MDAPGDYQYFDTKMNLLRVLKRSKILKPWTGQLKSLSSTANTSGVLSSLLSKEQVDVINRERTLFNEISSCLVQMQASQEDIDLINETKSRVDDIFMVVVVGEFNAGKSSFINSLLGEEFLKVDVLPTTSKIGILRRSSITGAQVSAIWRKAEKILLDDVEELDLPIDWLEHIAIIDTPGTNAIIQKHEALTHKIVPRSDLVLFVTSAERPITDSERDFLKVIHQWGRKVVVVVNKIDILPSAAKKQQVLDFVSQNVGNIVGSATPIKVFGVSSREALRAKLIAAKEGLQPSLGAAAKSWNESGMADVEDFLRNSLGKEELIKSKLQNPLILADRILSDSIATLTDRLSAIEADGRVLETIATISSQFNADLEKDTLFYRAQIQTLSSQIGLAADTFLDRNLSALNISMLLDAKRFQDRFADAVSLDLAVPVIGVMSEASELLLSRSKKHARAVVDYLGARPKRFQGSIVGVIQEAHFDAMHEKIKDRFHTDMQAVLQGYNHRRNIEEISTSIRSTIIATSAVQGLLFLSMCGLYGTQSMDSIALGAIVSSGLLTMGILPWKKSAIRRSLDGQIRLVASRLDNAAENALTNGRQRVVESVSESVAPYARFIQSEKDLVIDLSRQMEVLRVQIKEIRSTMK